MAFSEGLQSQNSSRTERTFLQRSRRKYPLPPLSVDNIDGYPFNPLKTQVSYLCKYMYPLPPLSVNA